MPAPTPLPPAPAPATIVCPECGATVERGHHAEKHAESHWPTNARPPLRTGTKTSALFHVRLAYLLSRPPPRDDQLDPAAREEKQRLFGRGA